jgi:predicted RNA-binding protein with TRAM domain
MEAFGVEQQIKSTLNRRVDLPSGGYLIFDYAEAFTVIDVNTGRYVGSRSKKSGGRLEDTITKNNLEAVKEVVRQLRLRDIGGIIVIDFIDMASPKNRAAVEKALGEELERDRTKTYVVEISPLGLVEMTRQNVTDGPREVMTKKCPTCGGDGIVVSEHTAAVDIERRLRSLVTPGSRDKAFKVEVAAKVANLVVGPGGSRLRELEETTKRRFFLAGKEGEHLDHFRVLDQGTLEKVAPKLPFDVGAEIEVKLGEIDKYDAHAGAGKVENVDVIVGDAAKLVGKKVKVRVTVVTEDTAWAELLTPVEPADEPLTAEAEAEKPTRAKRPSSRKKSDDAAIVDGDAEELDDEYEDEADEVDVAEDAVGEAPEAPADGDAPLTPKKRTRRGSRGGRNRKKKTATSTGTGGAIAAASTNGGEVQEVSDTTVPEAPVETGEAEQADESPAGPVIHVPGRDLGTEDGDTPAPVKKKTRRGSRGGKNRKKKTAAAAGVGVALATADAVADQAAEPEFEPEFEPTADEATVAVEDASVEEVQAPEEPAEAPVAEEPDPEPKPEEPSQNGDGDWGYTPMSQWGIDE